MRSHKPIDSVTDVISPDRKMTTMRIPKASNIGVATVLALSLTLGAGGVAQAAPNESASPGSVGVNPQPTTHQEFYDELKASDLP